MFTESEYEEDYYEGDFGAHFGASDDDELPWDELQEEEGAGVDLEDFRVRAWQRIYQHYVISLGSSGSPTNALLTEAELHMLNLDFTQALICALATETLEPQSETTALRRQMICTVALYQLGDKRKAIELRDSILMQGELDTTEGVVSEFLDERFRGTCEVLSMMPDLLSLLRSMPPQ